MQYVGGRHGFAVHIWCAVRVNVEWLTQQGADLADGAASEIRPMLIHSVSNPDRHNRRFPFSILIHFVEGHKRERSGVAWLHCSSGSRDFGCWSPSLDEQPS